MYRKFIWLAVVVTFVIAVFSQGLLAGTVAYWRFDDERIPDINTTETGLPVAPGNPLPDINGIDGWNSGLWRKAVHDWSGNGNHLTTWEYSWAGFEWSSDVPYAFVPQSYMTNGLGMVNTGSYPAAFTWSAQSNPGGIDINDITPAQFTIEASFKADSLTWAANTVVGRDATQVVTDDDPMAAVYFGVRDFPGSGVAAIQFADVSGYRHDATSAPGAITTGQWYNMVAVSDGSTLSLYLEEIGDPCGLWLVEETDLTLSGSPDTALAKGDSNGVDWTAGTWTVGRGLYDGGHGDRWFGYIDEVRISNVALSPSQFLSVLGEPTGKAYNPVPTMYSTNVSPCGTLSWDEGYADETAGHELYISTDFNDVNDREESFKHVLDTNSYTPDPMLEYGKTYHWCVDEVNGLEVTEGDIWQFTTYDGKATYPTPSDTQSAVSDETKLFSWEPALCAQSQDFYIGIDFNDVNESETPTEPGLAGDANSYTIDFDLQTGKTYYWRIDTHAGSNEVKGNIWEFTTEVAYLFSACDDFEQYHDYWTGTEGTIWDGIMGEDYLIQMNADDYNEGKLYIESDYCRWGRMYWYDTGPDSQAVFLYKNVEGPFIAEVELTDYSGLYDDTYPDLPDPDTMGGIMVRIPKLEDAGPGEDWLWNVYFPGYGVGNMAKHHGWYNADWSPEYGRTWTGWNNHRFLQIEHKGEGVFYLRHSDDGIVWESLNTGDVFNVDGQMLTVNPTVREDMAGLPMQVGIAHAQYEPVALGYAEYEYFCLSREPITKAYGPKPTDGGSMDLMDGICIWSGGDDAVKHNVYFSTDFNDVNERKPAADRGTDEVVSEGGGKFSYDAGLYESLVIGQTYFWCIDEIGDACSWPGDVWEFTVQDYTNIDNFETYASTGKAEYPPADTLKYVWVDGNFAFKVFPATPGTSGSLVQLNNDTSDGEPTYAHYVPEDVNIAQSGTKSMKFYYDNDGTVTWEVDLYGMFPAENYTYTPSPDQYLSEAYAPVDAAAALADGNGLGSLEMANRDWSGYKLLKISFYGDPNNTVNNAQMYAGLEDGDGTLVTLSNPDTSKLQKPYWQDWYIALSAFVAKDAELALTDIAKIYIGFGDKDSPQSGGTGVVFFDDIELLAYGVCIPGSVVGDFDDDCIVNNSDLELMTEVWLGEMPSGAGPIIELDAAGLNYGQLPAGGSYPNTGSDPDITAFADFNSTDPNDNPVVEDVQSVKCITFDGSDLLKADSNSPSSITGNNPFTIVCTVLNPDIGNEEWVMSWAKRGTWARYAGVGYGSNATFGAVAHWGGPDMGFDRGVPAANRWHTIAFTYEGGTNGIETIVVDGVVNATEAKTLDIWPDCPITIGSAYNGDPYIQPITPILFLSGSIAKLQVYDYAMSPGDLAIMMNTPLNLYDADNVINFKDIAVLGNNWLVGPVLLGD